MKEDYGLPDARTGHFPRLLLAAVVILGISLRAWGIGHHLPHRSYIEEDEFIYTALKYGTGDLNPHWYFHPPLYSYLLFTLYASLYAGGRVTGLYPDADAYIIGYLTDPSLWYLIARGLSALLFLPSLWLIYLIGKRVVSAGGAIVACLFFAVMPLAVSTSHYGCTEQLLILMALCAVWYSLRAAREGGVRNAILAGAFAGLAAGTKYTGVFALLPPCAAFLGGGRGSLRIFAASLTAAACAFLLVCPFPILSPREYFANIALLLSQPLSVGEYGWVRVRELHAAFFTHYLPAGMGAPLAWISVAGIIWLWLRRRREDCVVAVIPTAFFMITGFSSLFYDRYLLICYPFLAIAAAVLIDTVSSLSGRRRGPLLALLSVALAYPSCVASVRAVSTLVLPDTA
ncbi:MAG: glycosyltransferase family 39 protein, partial [Candidatus Aureabacteria bacterium]|nr:glycosyltransferase family 39 protein [Candidatus Auribacterota bacterium]